MRLDDNSNLVNAVAGYCWSTMRRWPVGPRDYNGTNEFVRPVGRMLNIAFEILGRDSVVFFSGWKPVIAGFGPQSSDARESSRPAGGSKATIRFIRGTFDPDQFIIAALDRFNKLNDSTSTNPHRRFFIQHVFGSGRRTYGNGGESSVPTSAKGVEPRAQRLNESVRILKWKYEELGSEIVSVVSPFDVLCYPPEVLELVEEAKHWKRSEQWYKDRQIPWRRGWLLHGKPGTGKTSLVRAVAQVEDMPIWIFDLSSMSNRDFVEIWRKMLESVPCIPLFEDFDATFDKRTNKLGENGGGLTFDCFLNTIGGIDSVDGVFMVVTTNHIHAVDEALGIAENGGISTRPGRIDRVLEFGPLDANCRRGIAVRVLRDYPDEIDRLVESGQKQTGAQFQERCARIALERYWQDNSVVKSEIT